MRKLVGLLLLLYPRQWRERYGEEFRALSEDARFRLSDGVDIISSAAGIRMDRLSGKPKWKLLAACALIGTIVGAIAAVPWPRRYQSTAVIRVDPAEHSQETITTELVAAVTGTATLSNIVRANHLYEKTAMSETEKAARLRSAATVSVIGRGRDAIMLQFVDSSPLGAQRVTAALVEACHQALPPTSTARVIDAPSLDKDPVSPNVFNMVLTAP